MRHRRSKGLRRRYGRALRRGRIDFGGGGVVPTESVRLTPGHTYAMGASTSPSLIDVVQVTDDRIRYRKHGSFGDTSEKVIERWIGEDLIASGERHFKASHGVSAHEWVTMSGAEREALVARHLRG